MTLTLTKNRTSEAATAVGKRRRKGEMTSGSITMHGVPKHMEVIAYITKTTKNNLSWISDIDVPPKELRNGKLAYSTRKHSLQRRMDRRKSKLEFEIPNDFKQLGKLLTEMKETERIIRQDNDFLYKIRSRKPKIELKLVDNLDLIPKPIEKHARFTAAPSRIPRSGIIFNEKKFY